MQEYLPYIVAGVFVLFIGYKIFKSRKSGGSGGGGNKPPTNTPK